MTKKFHILWVWVLAALLITSCSLNSKQEQAQAALQTFFDELAQGQYEAASSLYGGSYETLVSFNPDLNPDDYAGLWKMGCEVNGLKCLTIQIATFNEVTAKGEYIFTVEFNDLAGNLFVLDACCGENPATPPQFQFEYRVVEGGDGQFRVLDMPVYVP